MMVQTSRAQPDEEEPLALTASFELYIVVVLLGVAVVAFWEFMWWCVDHCYGEVRPSRSARRLRNLQETIQREVEVQIAERQRPATPLPRTPLGSPSTARTPTTNQCTRSTPRSSPAPRTASATSSRTPQVPETREAGIQVDARPLICYQDRAVPTPVPDLINWSYPLYVSPNGDTYHTYENCWGLRNTRARAVRFCQCCRDNQGRSLRERG